MDSLSNDPHRVYPDSADDAAMDAAEAAWIRQQEADDARRDDEQAEEAMTTPAERIAAGNVQIMDTFTATLGRKAV
jgi:hypothetical protein